MELETFVLRELKGIFSLFVKSGLSVEGIIGLGELFILSTKTQKWRVLWPEANAKIKLKEEFHGPRTLEQEKDE